MSMDWTFIPIEQATWLERETALAVYKCQECGKFGHIELDCPRAETLRAELARREALAAEKARRDERADWIAKGILFLLVVGIFALQMWMKGN